MLPNHNVDTATIISSRWPLFTELPKPVTDALAVFEEAGYAQEPFDGIDPDKVTTGNVEATIIQLAETIAAKEKFFQSRNYVRNLLARNVVFAGAEAAPEMLAAKRAEFDSAAERFIESVDQLPETLTSETLVNGGPAVLAAYQEALASQAVIMAFDQWLATLSNLPGMAYQTEPYLRVLKPADADDLYALENANRDQLQLVPFLVAAARLGIEFEPHTPREIAELRADIESRPATDRQIKFN
ncbi:hypothetical protein [Mycolicibacterium llatzerense]|uniref:hypothetical protein n=1 Tax=Mycolicibacterium llatzerense TaxID=280871 RepID=UPI0008DDFAF8|nr:hypothetical protein [Mycolicibacterium llatzerense]